MAPLSILMAGVRMLKAGSRAAAVGALKKKHGLSDALAKRVITKANELTKLSDKTGKPISKLVKEGTGAQTVTKNVAKKGLKTGAIAGGAVTGAGIAGLDALVDSISKATTASGDTKSATSARRKSPEGGQTIVENRRVVSETKLAKGGALKKAPSDAKGLKKLPTKVRNKMGYMAKGGAVKGFKPCAGCTSPKTCAKSGCKKKKSK